MIEKFMTHTFWASPLIYNLMVFNGQKGLMLFAQCHIKTATVPSNVVGGVAMKSCRALTRAKCVGILCSLGW